MVVSLFVVVRRGSSNLSVENTFFLGCFVVFIFVCHSWLARETHTDGWKQTMTHRETKLCVDGIILSNDGGKSVYLMKRAGDVEHGKWAFPGGRVDTTDDSDVDALVREVSEELGVQTSTADWTRFVGVANNHRDPRGFTTTIVFYNFLNPASAGFSLNKSEASAGKWFNILSLSQCHTNIMAFDHLDILKRVVRHITNLKHIQ